MATNINIPVEDELHSNLKMKALEKDISLKQLIIKTLEESLK